jgi:catalase (peroxidase I)
VDQDFHENFGTREPIMALKPIADKYSKMLSRADIWALATLVGSDVSQPSDASFKTDFAFEEIGSKYIDC